jgi:hypothetical protein
VNERARVITRVSASIVAAALLAAVPAVARAITLTWVGDISFSTREGLPPNGGRGVFAPVASALRGTDLALGNLEGTLGHGGSSKCSGGRGNCFAFQAPPALAGVLRGAGFGLVNLANNHSRDFGDSGLRQTKDALRRARLAQTGLDHEIAIRRVGGVRTAFLGFAPYPWTSPLTDIPAARRLIATAARRARIVVVIVHAGAEGARAVHVPHGTETAFGENRGNTRGFVHAAIDAGADVVLGSGPHVLRGMECYRRRLIAYSLGDFAGYNTLSTAGVLALTGALRVRLTATGSLDQARLLPMRLVRPGVPRPDPGGASIQLVRRLSRQDFGARACRVSGSGRVTLPTDARAGTLH